MIPAIKDYIFTILLFPANTQAGLADRRAAMIPLYRELNIDSLAKSPRIPSSLTGEGQGEGE